MATVQVCASSVHVVCIVMHVQGMVETQWA